MRGSADKPGGGTEPGGGAMILPVAVRTGGGAGRFVFFTCETANTSPTFTNRSTEPSCPARGMILHLVATAAASTVPARPKSRSSMSPAVRPTSSGRTNALLADNRRGQAGEAVVLPRFEMVLAVVVFELEEVRLHAGQVARGAECGEALVVELLPEGVPLVARQVGEVDDLHRAELAERRRERGVRGRASVARGTRRTGAGAAGS